MNLSDHAGYPKTAVFSCLRDPTRYATPTEAGVVATGRFSLFHHQNAYVHVQTRACSYAIGIAQNSRLRDRENSLVNRRDDPFLESDVLTLHLLMLAASVPPAP